MALPAVLGVAIDSAGALKSIGTLGGALSGLGATGEKVAQGLKGAFTSLGAVLGKAAGALAPLSAAISGVGVVSVLAGNQAKITERQFQTVFANIGDAAQKSAEQIAGSYGKGVGTVQDLMQNVGKAVSGLGFDAKSTLNFSTAISQLAIDMESFSGGATTAAQAADVINSAMMGATRGLKQFGISIDTDDIKKYAEAHWGLTKDLTKEQEAFATLQLIMAKSGAVAGATQAAWGGFDRAISRVSQAYGDLKETIGIAIIDELKLGEIIGGVADIINRATKFITEMDGETKKLIIGIAGGIVVATGLAAAIAAAVAAISFFGPQALLAAGALLALGGAAGGSLSMGLDVAIGYVEDLINWFLRLGETAPATFNMILEVGGKVWNNLGAFCKAAFFDMLESAKNFVLAIPKFLSTVWENFKIMFWGVVDIAGKVFKNLGSIVYGFAADTIETLQNLGTAIWDFLWSGGDKWEWKPNSKQFDRALQNAGVGESMANMAKQFAAAPDIAFDWKDRDKNRVSDLMESTGINASIKNWRDALDASKEKQDREGRFTFAGLFKGEKPEIKIEAPEGLQISGAEIQLPESSGKDPEKYRAEFAQLALKGSVEAYKSALAQQQLAAKTDPNVENTKRTAENTRESNGLLRDMVTGINKVAEKIGSGEGGELMLGSL
jgi:hypothetical protein